MAGAGIAAAGAYLDAKYHISKDVANMWRARKHMKRTADNSDHILLHEREVQHADQS